MPACVRSDNLGEVPLAAAAIAGIALPSPSQGHRHHQRRAPKSIQDHRRGTAIAACSLLGFVAASQAQEKAAYPTLGSIERLDPRFDKLVPLNARVERIADGFDWSEGPVWDRSRKVLLFSDVPMNTVFQWQEGKGVSIFLKPSGYTGSVPRGGEPGSNGLNMDQDGRLILCQHGDRRVARLEADKTFKTLADNYMGKRFNSPNDSVYNAKGDLYFTDPPYGLLKLNADPAKELEWNGVYRISASDGTVTLLTKEMTFPNGIAFHPTRRLCTWQTLIPGRQSGWPSRSGRRHDRSG